MNNLLISPKYCKPRAKKCKPHVLGLHERIINQREILVFTQFTGKEIVLNNTFACGSFTMFFTAFFV